MLEARPAVPAPPGATDWEARLRASGCRVTRARLLVLQALAEMSHATGEELLTRISPSAPDINLSTIYRTLDVLGEAGLVTHAHFHHSTVTYHAVDGPAHIHLVCRTCGQVSSVAAALAGPLAGQVAELTGFRADISHLTLHGQCASCLAPSAGRVAPGPGVAVDSVADRQEAPQDRSPQ